MPRPHFQTGPPIGVAGPVFYSVWVRRRPLASLGLTLGDGQTTAALAVVFAAVQFALTLARAEYPAPEVWLPLLAVAGAAGLNGLYRVGYGTGLNEIAFLFRLGIVYAVAFRVAGSILVLWPLLTSARLALQSTPGRDIVMRKNSMGFADVLVLMLAAT